MREGEEERGGCWREGDEGWERGEGETEEVDVVAGIWGKKEERVRIGVGCKRGCEMRGKTHVFNNSYSSGF